MKYIDYTHPTSHQNLAFDEALLDLCEEDGFDDELLRCWEPSEPFVVLGYSNKMESEINELSCRKRGIPVLRRCSGGGTVLQGPGCLNFTLVLSLLRRDCLRNITKTNAFIMEANRQALSSLLGEKVEIRGYSDLTTGAYKFSGNAQRRKKKHVLFHGTFLCHFDISSMEEILKIPEKQPPYRENRPHADFLRNLGVPPSAVKQALREKWAAREELRDLPLDRMKRLAEEKYSQNAWNRKF